MPPRLLVAAGVGAAVALTLGIYGNVHDPSQKLVFTLGFSSTIAMKVWLGTIALAFAVIQVTTALWVYGKLPWSAPAWAGSCHTLEAAGTSGQVGPALDGIALGPGEIEAVVREGRGGMPSFQGRLAPAEIKAVAAYVAKSR